MVRRRFVVALGLAIAAASAWAFVGPGELVDTTPSGIEFEGPVLEPSSDCWVMTLRHSDGWLAARVDRVRAAAMFPPSDAVDLAAGVDVRKMTRTLRVALLQAYAESRRGAQYRINRGEGLWI